MVLSAVAAPVGDDRPGRRTEQQIMGAMAGHTASGLEVQLGGETRYLRPLTLKGERTWKTDVARVVTAAAQVAGNIRDLDTIEGIRALLGENVDDALELVVSFDALGDGTLNREWLEDHASGMELRATLEVLLDSVFPPRSGAATKPSRIVMDMILAGAAARAALADSTNGSSPGTRGSTGPKTSKRR